MSWYDPSSWGDNSGANIANRKGRAWLQQNAYDAAQNAKDAQKFTTGAQSGFQQDDQALGQSYDFLRRLASGQDSVSAEQLRQGNQQSLAQQQSIAAGASPQDASMSARTAAIQSGRLSSGLAGQQAVAGLQERNQAQSALAQLLLQKRQQDLQGTLGGYGAVNQGYGTSNQGYGGMVSGAGDQNWVQRNAGVIAGGSAVAAAGAGGK